MNSTQLRFEVLTAMIVKSSILCYITPCSPLTADVSEEHVACFHVGFLLGVFFDPEDGVDVLLRNVG
jgi:hypothetical protein